MGNEHSWEKERCWQSLQEEEEYLADSPVPKASNEALETPASCKRRRVEEEFKQLCFVLYSSYLFQEQLTVLLSCDAFSLSQCFLCCSYE